MSTIHTLKFQLGLCVLLQLASCGNNRIDGAQRQEEQANTIVHQMSTREKIGQKIMLAFRYWCQDDQPDCTTGMTHYNDAVGTAIAENNINGVLLFSENLTDLAQTAELTQKLQQAVNKNSPLGLFIAIDQEGGNVARLPRNLSTVFPGNMALGAAYLATNNAQLAYQQGKVMASELKTVGVNLNFAPVVDVNSNPFNPIINVRSFSDDAHTVGTLGMEMARGMADQNVVSAFKHFPGHGDTATDSHLGLPIVTKSAQEAYAIDLHPYIHAINHGSPPEMIMTAHIQYPVLDDSTILTKAQEKIIVPATLSRKIQHQLLRTELGYQGVTITDALDMKAISNLFEEPDAVIKTFQAGVDIALMPIEFRTAATAGRLSSLIDAVVAAVDSGKISKTELDQSVQRIVLLKLQHTVLNAPRLQYFLKPGDIGTPDNKALESEIVNKSITLLKNEASLLPLQLGRNNIHIITPLAEQTDALRMRFHQLGHASVTGAHIANTTFEDQQAAVDAAEIIIIGSNSTAPMPLIINGDPHTWLATQKFALEPRAASETGRRSLVYNVEGDRFDRSQANKLRSVGSDNQFMRYVIEYAKSNNKKIIHITLRAPHDVVNFDDLADVTLATYSYMGYAQFLRGPSLPAVVDVILGRTPALGKLPVNIWNLNPDGSLGSLKYARGFGLSSAAL